jgi:hypothetical protein
MIPKNFLNAFSAAGLMLLLTNCNNRRIEYSLNNTDSYPAQQLNNIVLDIEVFDDRRMEHEKNKVLFKRPVRQTKEERGWYFNRDKKYIQSVPAGMTSMLAAHLLKRGSFKSVKINSSDSSDYYLKGTLHYFYGAQLPAKAKALWMFSFLIPPLMAPALILSLTEKSKSIAIIEINNLEIYSRNDQLIFKTDVKRRYERKYRSWGGQNAVFRSTNYALQEYFSELIITIEREIGSAELQAANR